MKKKSRKISLDIENIVIREMLTPENSKRKNNTPENKKVIDLNIKNSRQLVQSVKQKNLMKITVQQTFLPFMKKGEKVEKGISQIERMIREIKRKYSIGEFLFNPVSADGIFIEGNNLLEDLSDSIPAPPVEEDYEDDMDVCDKFEGGLQSQCEEVIEIIMDYWEDDTSFLFLYLKRLQFLFIERFILYLEEKVNNLQAFLEDNIEGEIITIEKITNKDQPILYIKKLDPKYKTEHYNKYLFYNFPHPQKVQIYIPQEDNRTYQNLYKIFISFYGSVDFPKRLVQLYKKKYYLIEIDNIEIEDWWSKLLKDPEKKDIPEELKGLGENINREFRLNLTVNLLLKELGEFLYLSDERGGEFVKEIIEIIQMEKGKAFFSHKDEIICQLEKEKDGLSDEEKNKIDKLIEDIDNNYNKDIKEKHLADKDFFYDLISARTGVERSFIEEKYENIRFSESVIRQANRNLFYDIEVNREYEIFVVGGKRLKEYLIKQLKEKKEEIEKINKNISLWEDSKNPQINEEVKKIREKIEGPIKERIEELEKELEILEKEVRKRREVILTEIARIILSVQKDFIERKQPWKNPLTIKDVYMELKGKGISLNTIYYIFNNNTIYLSWYESRSLKLNYFLEDYLIDKGGKRVSKGKIKNYIKEIIKKEKEDIKKISENNVDSQNIDWNKYFYNDTKIAIMINREFNVSLSPRTIAKYRKEMDIANKDERYSRYIAKKLINIILENTCLKDREISEKMKEAGINITISRVAQIRKRLGIPPCFRREKRI